MRQMPNGVWAALLAAIVVVAGGCSGGSRPGRFDVDVRLHADMQGRGDSLEVDLIGVNPTDTTILEMPVDTWFTPDSPTRRNTNHVTFAYTREDRSPKRLRRTDGIWGEWLGSGADTLLVLVNKLPESSSDGARRLALSLDTGLWKGNRLEIVVSSDRLRCVTQRKLPE